MKLELNLFREDFDIEANFSFLHRIVRTMIIVLLAALLIVFIELTPVSFSLLLIALIFGGTYLLDKVFRKYYADWPNPKKFVGKIIFTPEQLELIGNDGILVLPLTDFSELLIFTDYYTGYVHSGIDLQRNGNALIFLKTRDELVRVLKFNIPTESEYLTFFKLKEGYRSSINNFREYGTSELYHILKPDLSERLTYH